MKTLVVATPTTRPFEAEYVVSLFQTKGNVQWFPMRNRPVDEARNVLAAKFLQAPGKPEYLLFADSDATWHPEAPLRLMERDLPVVTGFIYRRKLPPVPTIGNYVGRNEKGSHIYEFASTVRSLLEYTRARGIDTDTENELVLEKTDEVNDLLEVSGCGAHFLLIRRDAFKHLRMPYFRCTGLGAGEDFFFCRKLREAGIPIYADLTVHTGHIAGPGNNFGLRELLSYMKHVDSGEVLAGEQRWEV